MNNEKFLEDFKWERVKKVVSYCLNQVDWFSGEKLINKIANETKERHILKGFKSQGRPGQILRTIKYLIRIGFLLTDPQRGLKVNKDFIPTSQL